MNINAINGQNFAGVTPKKLPTIKYVNKLDNYTYDMINSFHADLEKSVCFYGKDLLIAQKGKKLLANSGNITTTLDMNKLYGPAAEDYIQPKKFFMDFFLKNLRANNITEEKSLTEGFKSLNKAY